MDRARVSLSIVDTKLFVDLGSHVQLAERFVVQLVRYSRGMEICKAKLHRVTLIRFRGPGFEG